MRDAQRAFLEAIGAYNKTEKNQICVSTDELLAHHTTFKIGGHADLYAEPTDESQLAFLLQSAKACDFPFFVMGRGSNLLFDDGGYRGIVISTSAMRSMQLNGNCITADAGASLRACAQFACQNELTGMEFAHGIPGSCGGAVYMNAGAYDGEMSQIVLSSRYLDTESDTFGETQRDGHKFAYRHSVYRTCRNWIILSSVFQLQPGDSTEIREKMEELMRRRTEKQPLEYPSAGSVFKRYPGKYTAQMIDEAGLKGYTVGGAQVSEKHAGFIVNRGGATCADVLRLIEQIKETVLLKCGVANEAEIVYVPQQSGTL